MIETVIIYVHILKSFLPCEHRVSFGHLAWERASFAEERVSTSRTGRQKMQNGSGAQRREEGAALTTVRSERSLHPPECLFAGSHHRELSMEMSKSSLAGAVDSQKERLLEQEKNKRALARAQNEAASARSAAASAAAAAANMLSTQKAEFPVEFGELSHAWSTETRAGTGTRTAG